MVRRKKTRLTAKEVASAKKPGRLVDGDGLCLQISKSGAKSWIFRFRWGDKQKEMGLGSVDLVSLAVARDKAFEARRQAAAGINPIEARRQSEAEAERQEIDVPTFQVLGEQLIAEWSKSWKSDVHKRQWIYTITELCGPLRSMLVSEIGTDDVLGVLQPLWTRLPETARRARGRIERILDAARVKNYRTGENPARWQGHLELLLSTPVVLSRGHHAAMPYAEVPAFVAELRTRKATSALALEFLILTAARSGEVLAMRKSEVDFDEAVWIVPAERMKAKREHRVPLTDRTVEIVRKAWSLSPDPDGYVFASANWALPLSSMALAMQMRRMGCEAYTAHGFRSAFRDWAGDQTTIAREVAEAALAHIVGDKAEQAYRRGDALDKRRGLMELWSNYNDMRAAV